MKKVIKIYLLLIMINYCCGCNFSFREDHNLMIILDLSTSMDADYRLEETKKSLCKFIDNDVPNYFNIGFRVFSNDTEPLFEILPKETNARIMKNKIMNLSSIGGTNFESILSELPKDFQGLTGRHYVLVAGDGQYGTAVYEKVKACRKELEKFATVKGISVGIDLPTAYKDNLEQIAIHFTTPGEEPIFTNVDTNNFKGLSDEFYKIRYALSILYRIIAFCICIAISIALTNIIYEICIRLSIIPKHALTISSLLFPFFILICFRYYLSDVINEYFNLLAIILYIVISCTYAFGRKNNHKDNAFTEKRSDLPWEE